MANYTESINGIKILLPDGWTQSNSRNGERIAVPPGWTPTEGRAGRRIPIAPGWMWTEDIQGLKIPVPPGWFWRQAHNGLRVPIPPTGQISRGYAGNTLVVDSTNRKISVGSLEVSVLETGMMISGSGGGIWVEY